MNVRTLLAALVVVGVAAALAVPGFTEEPTEPSADPMGEAMKEAMKEAGTPGPDHAWMSFMVGSWNVAAKFWEGPGEPQTSEGRMETRWIKERRYLRSDYTGEWEGATFHGEATMGFDKITGRYKTVWIDSMSTNIAFAEGTREGDVITTRSKGSMPMMGDYSARTVYTKKSADEYVMEEYWTMEGMGEMKGMELTFRRAK